MKIKTAFSWHREQTVLDSTAVKVLENKRWRAESLSTLLLLLLMLTPAFAIAVFLLATVMPDETWDQRWSRVTDYVSHFDWSQINWERAVASSVAFTLFPLPFLHIFRAKKMQRLTLSPDGIMYTSPFLSILPQFSHDWFLPWNEVTKAELNGPQKRRARADLVQLTLSGPTEVRRLVPALWIDPEGPSPPPSRHKPSILSSTESQKEMLELVMNSEVIRYISKTRPNLSIDSNIGTVIAASSEIAASSPKKEFAPTDRYFDPNRTTRLRHL